MSAPRTKPPETDFPQIRFVRQVGLGYLNLTPVDTHLTCCQAHHCSAAVITRTVAQLLTEAVAFPDRGAKPAGQARQSAWSSGRDGPKAPKTGFSGTEKPYKSLTYMAFCFGCGEAQPALFAGFGPTNSAAPSKQSHQRAVRFPVNWGRFSVHVRHSGCGPGADIHANRGGSSGAPPNSPRYKFSHGGVWSAMALSWPLRGRPRLACP
jgi:hypothetical protein